MSNLEEEEEKIMIIPPPDSKRLRHDYVENEDRFSVCLDSRWPHSSNEDRLSDLPDCVLLHILSLLNTEHTVRTCILSMRWKYLWKRLPVLRLHCSGFSTLEIFIEFVSKVLSLRDHSISLRILDFHCEDSFELPLLEGILKYATSHNVQRLGLYGRHDNIEQIPTSCIFSCQTLTHLKLASNYPISGGRGTILFPKSLNLPALTVLYLRDFTFCAGANDNVAADPFFTFNKLSHLVLSECDVRGDNALTTTTTLRISSSTLIRLSMSYDYRQPKSLKIVELCTPSLSTFIFTGEPHMRFQGRRRSNLSSSVKHVDIDARYYPKCMDSACNLLSWLLHFVGIESLVLSATTLHVLSFIPDLLKDRLPFLENLNSLKVLDELLPDGVCWFIRLAELKKTKSVEEATKQYIHELELRLLPSPPLPGGIVDFLLQNSPSAQVEIVDHSRCPFLRRSMDLTF